MLPMVTTTASPLLLQVDVPESSQRFLFVVYQLTLQVLEVIEHTVFAYPVVKVHGDVVTINIAVKIEKVDFETLPRARHRGAIANVHHALIAAVLVIRGHSVDAVGRYQLETGVDFNVGGGKSEDPSQFVAVHDPARETVGASEEMICCLNIASSNRVPDTGRTHAHVIYILPWDFFHFKAVLRGVGNQLFKASFAVATKAVIVSDDQLACPQCFDKDLANELLRRIV